MDLPEAAGPAVEYPATLPRSKPRGSDWQAFCLERLASCPVRTEPFPHLVVEALVPPDFYAELLGALPDRGSFRKASYAGAGFSVREPHYREHGLVLTEDALPAALADAIAFLQSERFARALLTRFSTPLDDGSLPMPAHKHAAFADGARDFHSRAHVHLDLPGYEIPPHPDAPDKLVTFQWFLSKDASLREYGTHFLRPSAGRETVAHARYLGVRRCFTGLIELLGLTDSAPMRRLRRTRFALRTGLVSTTWFPWEWFESVAMAEALPNHFMAFAPSPRTYHAVRLDLPPDHPSPGRPVIRGFVRQGADVFERVTLE